MAPPEPCAPDLPPPEGTPPAPTEPARPPVELVPARPPALAALPPWPAPPRPAAALPACAAAPPAPSARAPAPPLPELFPGLPLVPAPVPAAPADGAARAPAPAPPPLPGAPALGFPASPEPLLHAKRSASTPASDANREPREARFGACEQGIDPTSRSGLTSAHPSTGRPSRIHLANRLPTSPALLRFERPRVPSCGAHVRAASAPAGR